MCIVLVMCLCMWISAGYTDLDATLVALIGVVALLQMGTITWKDISSNTNAVSIYCLNTDIVKKNTCIF